MMEVDSEVQPPVIEIGALSGRGNRKRKRQDDHWRTNGEVQSREKKIDAAQKQIADDKKVAYIILKTKKKLAVAVNVSLYNVWLTCGVGNRKWDSRSR